MILAFAGFGLGPMEIAIVAIIALLLFGKRLPSIARSLGSSVVQFKKGINGVEDEIRDAENAVAENVAASRKSLHDA